VRIDAILLDCSIWTWAERTDPELPGLHEAGQRDLEKIFARIESTLEGFAAPLPFGHFTIAEFAFWPHLAALRPLGFSLDEGKHPRLAAWFGAMRGDPVFRADARRTAAFMKAIGTHDDLERGKLFWRGDRIEWLLARGFHDWFFDEIKAGRTLWPK
jgi:hypothetical protein